MVGRSIATNRAPLFASNAEAFLHSPGYSSCCPFLIAFLHNYVQAVYRHVADMAMGESIQVDVRRAALHYLSVLSVRFVDQPYSLPTACHALVPQLS